MQKKLQVFISSTFTDLIAERQAAVAAILKAGHIPAGMELFTSGDQSQMDVIRRWIDESDIYMLILGGRYGSVEPKTELSYTELEFDYAVAKEKPLFSIIATEQSIEEKVRSQGSSVVERENPKQLKQFREKALSNVSSFFSDEKDVKLAVYESLGDLSARPELVGWVRATEVSRFEDQVSELDQLRDENRKLREEIGRTTSLKSANTSPDYQAIAQTISDVHVKLPEELRPTPEDDTRDLLTLLLNNRDQLVAGVTDSPFNTAAAQFLYYNLATKLKVHGLMADKRLVGKKINCLATTPLGDGLLAWVDKRVSEKRREQKSGSEGAA